MARVALFLLPDLLAVWDPVCRRCSEVELDVEFFGFVKFYEIIMKH